MIDNERPQVIIRHCEPYDVPTIRAIIRDWLRQMKFKPYVRTGYKPVPTDKRRFYFSDQ